MSRTTPHLTYSGDEKHEVLMRTITYFTEVKKSKRQNYQTLIKRKTMILCIKSEVQRPFQPLELMLCIIVGSTVCCKTIFINLLLYVSWHDLIREW